jgi:hypothetical protein
MKDRLAPGNLDGCVTSATPLARPPALYHYCPLTTFKAILTNGCVWLSDANYMNDTTEGDWLEKIVERTIRRSEEWRVWRESGHVYSDYKIFKRTFYIACFSEHGDILSQWRAYAEDGRGACIGFDFSELPVPTGLSLSDVFGMRGLGCTLDRVVYEEKAQLEVARRVFRGVDYLTRAAPPIETAVNSYFLDAYVNAGQDGLAYASRLLKHPGFSEEREWRIAYDGDDGKIGPRVAGLGAIQYRMRGKERIAYYELDLRTLRRPIRDVVLGPKCAMSVDAARRFLRGAGFESARVRRSAVPYR